jgi:hypothetical protein
MYYYNSDVNLWYKRDNSSMVITFTSTYVISTYYYEHWSLSLIHVHSYIARCTRYNIICKRLYICCTCNWFSPGTLVSFTNKMDFLTLQDKHNIRTLSVSTTFICTNFRNGLRSYFLATMYVYLYIYWNRSW